MKRTTEAGALVTAAKKRVRPTRKLSEVCDNGVMEETMNLTHEQKQAINEGQAVPVVVDHTECVVIRKDIYERVRSAFDPSETYQAVLNAWDADGSRKDAEMYADFGRRE